MKKSFHVLIFSFSLIAFVLNGAKVCSQTQKNFLYHGQNYGSESQLNGLNPFFNVGLLLASRYNYSESLSDIAYKKAF